MKKLTERRRDAGYTQRAFVAAFLQEAVRLRVNASISVRQVRRWERGSPPPLPHPSQQLVLEALFGVPLAEMGFEAPAHRRTVPGPVGDSRVRRRAFVADTGVLAVAALAPVRVVPWFGRTDVARLRTRLDGLYRTDHMAGSVPAMHQARAIEREIDAALGNTQYTAPVGCELRTLLAESYGHRAWYCYDGGRIEEGRRVCTEALAAAQLVDDPLLQVSVLETLVLLALKGGRTWEAASAVESADRLAVRGGAGHTVRLVVSLRDADVAAHAGDLAGARRALSRALGHQGRADADDEVPNWARFAGPFEIDHATAGLCVRAGQPARAVPFLRAAVRGVGGGLARNSASYRLKLAGALLAAGEVDEACAEMGPVLDACRGISSPRLVDRMKEFGRAAGRVDSAAARECRDRVREAVRGGAA